MRGRSEKCPCSSQGVLRERSKIDGSLPGETSCGQEILRLGFLRANRHRESIIRSSGAREKRGNSSRHSRLGPSSDVLKPRAGFEPAMGGSAGRCVRPNSATLAHLKFRDVSAYELWSDSQRRRSGLGVCQNVRLQRASQICTRGPPLCPNITPHPRPVPIWVCVTHSGQL